MNIADAFNGLIQKVCEVLPLSPFSQFLDEFADIPYLPWLNWFFPIKECLIVMSAWLTAIALWYTYSVVARWIKLAGE